MKRLSVWLLGAFYGLLTISGVNFPHNTTPADPRGIKISSITQDTPLYLEHSGAIHSNPMHIMQSWHSSHESHYSHGSHESHHSHYSG
jgi:hypothetical protein